MPTDSSVRISLYLRFIKLVYIKTIAIIAATENTVLKNKLCKCA